MLNNDILRRIRYISDFNDSKMMALFSAVDLKVTRDEISDWLKKEEDPAYKKISDEQFSYFLNGLIIHYRGKKEGQEPVVDKKMNNNVALKKLKIAYNLQSDEILAILEDNDVILSKHELSALFRKPDHKHYRECKDQIMRNFLKGLQHKYRGYDL